jgi:hypothetical protein
MFRGLPLHVAAGVCAMAICAAPLHAQPNLKRWLFAEGSTNQNALGFEQEILIGNPNAVAANVTLKFLPQDGGPPIYGTIVVDPLTRRGINARQFVGNAPGVALEVIADVDIVVERSMYWGGGVFNFPASAGPPYGQLPIIDMRAGHNVLGVHEPRTSWSFAEGAAGGPFGFQTFVLVSNPSDHVGAAVTVNYLTPEGQTFSDVKLLPPGQRVTFWANAALPQSAHGQVDFAIEVQSDNAAIVAERAMYWGPNFLGGHASMGVQPTNVWYFSEGVQGSPVDFNTFLLLFNPHHTPIDVVVDFFGPTRPGETPVRGTRTVTVAPRSRTNVWAAEFPQLLGAENAFSIRAVTPFGESFVAERAVYWRGLREGTASAGTPAPARKWGFADGQEGGFAQFQNPADADPRAFSTYYQVLNNTPNPVMVRGVFYLEGTSGEGVEATIEVPALSRETFGPANYAGLHNRKFAAFFEASDEVIIERAVYWGAGIQAGHASAGAPLPDALPMLPAPTAPGAPALAAIAPNRGTPSGGTVVTITGAGFGLKDSAAGPTTVSFGVTPVPPQNITVLNANQIRVVTPASGKGFASIIVNTRGTQVELPGAYEFFDKNAAIGPSLATYPTLREIPQVFGGYNLWGTLVTLGSTRFGDLLDSCRTHTWMFETVAEFRKLTGTNRWGLNWKRGVVGDYSHDVVTYFWGEEGEVMRNNNKVFLIDIIGNHCPISGSPSPAWFGVTEATFGNNPNQNNGRWTTDPMCGIPRYRDMVHNGQFVFPECRD